MAKNKKNIKQFQDALLSNTSFIQKKDREDIDDNNQETIKKSPRKNSNNVKIKEEHLENIKLLAQHLDEDHTDLINLAVRHFLGLKYLRLEEAKEKFKND